MNMYEDKYLREKVIRIITRQKEGKIVIAMHKDDSGLPSREDLGQELSRAAHPYDYAVGKAGFLTYRLWTRCIPVYRYSGRETAACIGKLTPADSG